MYQKDVQDGFHALKVVKSSLKADPIEIWGITFDDNNGVGVVLFNNSMYLTPQLTDLNLTIDRIGGTNGDLMALNGNATF